MMDRETSLVAKIAADFGFEPLSIWVVMFSNTTMESSTTIPMAILKEDKEMIFSVLPPNYPQGSSAEGPAVPLCSED